MGEIFKRNWKRVTGVRPDDAPQSDDLARLSEASGIGGVSGSGGGLGPIEIKSTLYEVISPDDNNKVFILSSGNNLDIPTTPVDGFQILAVSLGVGTPAIASPGNNINFWNGVARGIGDPLLSDGSAWIHLMYSAAGSVWYAIAQGGTVGAD